MSSIANIQQIISNIAGVEKVQHAQQQQVQAEQAIYTSEGQKRAKIKGKKIEDKEPVDIVEISVKDDRKDQQEESQHDDQETNEESNQEESLDNKNHIDITV